MTWKHTLLAPVFGFLALVLPFCASAQNDDEILPQTLPVALNEADPSVSEVGELIYKGGLKIEPGEEKIGGISGLEWIDNEEDYGGGALYAVSDDGRWLKIVTDESNAELSDLYSIQMDWLRGPKGKRLKRKSEADAEAITFDSQWGWLVAFEQEHRMLRYGMDLSGPGEPFTRFISNDPSPSAPNKGYETLAAYLGGAIYCVEAYSPGNGNCRHVLALKSREVAPPASLIEHNGVPTDAACLDNDICYVLFRSYKPGYGNRAAIIELSREFEAKTLAVFDAPLSVDNFEGLAVREQFGKRYLYLASDDNFNNCFDKEGSASCQDTLIMKFEIKQPDAPPPPIANAPKPDGTYATTNVVLKTNLGSITIAVETQRAPITAANFLRYVDEGRFDGTVFYRAMRLPREPQPNGLVQAGTRGDSKRTLPPIAHEPTTKTGLSHTNGAVSMAMGEPGTATGDFTIMLQDQTGLNADPKAKEAAFQNGYAVFGYVIEGMDVIGAIHASGNDPEKGEGFMKGQMLAKPVVITSAKRADPIAQ